MQNDQGQPVDLYIPRKCSWTNRLIEAFDKASVQVNVANMVVFVNKMDMLSEATAAKLFKQLDELTKEAAKESPLAAQDTAAMVNGGACAAAAGLPLMRGCPLLLPSLPIQR